MTTDLKQGFRCKKCGNDGFVLRAGGVHVGAYCSQCEKWIMWIPKKELEFWKNRGVSILPPANHKANEQESAQMEALDFLRSQSKKTLQSQKEECICHSAKEIPSKNNPKMKLKIVSGIMYIIDSTTEQEVCAFDIEYCPICGDK